MLSWKDHRHCTQSRRSQGKLSSTALQRWAIWCWYRYQYWYQGKLRMFAVSTVTTCKSSMQNKQFEHSSMLWLLIFMCAKCDGGQIGRPYYILLFSVNLLLLLERKTWPCTCTHSHSSNRSNPSQGHLVTVCKIISAALVIWFVSTGTAELVPGPSKYTHYHTWWVTSF